MTIEFLPAEPYSNNAAEYIDSIFQEQKEHGANPEYVEIFGNKAVKYTIFPDDTNIVGYLNFKSTPVAAETEEYLIKIDTATYGSGTSFDEKRECQRFSVS